MWASRNSPQVCVRRQCAMVLVPSTESFPARRGLYGGGPPPASLHGHERGREARFWIEALSTPRSFESLASRVTRFTMGASVVEGFHAAGALGGALFPVQVQRQPLL